MRAVTLGALVAVAWVAPARGQAGNPLPVPPESKTRTTSSPAPYDRETFFKRKYTDENDRRQKLERELDELRQKLGKSTPAEASSAAGAVTPGATPAPPGATEAASVAGSSPDGKTVPARLDAPVPLATPGAKRRPNGSRKGKGAVSQASFMPATSEADAAAAAAEQPLVFAVSEAALDQAVNGRETAVPLGSYVKARILTGVEANTHEAYPVLLQLDYAFVGPNRTRVDLSHCFMVAKAKANLSTERVMAETQQLSCVRRNDEIVTRAAKGYVAGEDSTFGVTGELISHQGQVLVAAVLASLAKGAGEAVAQAQTTTQVATGGIGGVATATNVTGDKALYYGGKAITEPATLIANWYLDYAKQLVPSIAVGSGRDVWIVLLDTVRVPELDADAAVDEDGRG